MQHNWGSAPDAEAVSEMVQTELPGVAARWRIELTEAKSMTSDGSWPVTVEAVETSSQRLVKFDFEREPLEDDGARQQASAIMNVMCANLAEAAEDSSG